ncbi:hypothetical protein HOA92_04195 [archaeon]|jgi:adenylyl- and sulfurtransferase ThiI|nr:hypothetical protein [archaeon]MBT6762215.1 hypothetical protein [archaeon]
MTDKIQYSHILVRIASEIFLKGKNQNSFVNKLRENIKKLTGQSQISKGRGRMLIPFFEGHQKLQRVFGVHSYSLAAFIPKKEDSDEDIINKIQHKAIHLLENDKGSFHCRTKRSDKTFSKTSVEINHQIGEFIEEKNKNLVFKLKGPDIVIGIEINETGAFVYKDRVICPGGLPAGIEGEAGVMLKDESSLLAALLMMKRGVGITLIKERNCEVLDLSLIEAFSPRPIKIVENVEAYIEKCKRRPCVIVKKDIVESLIEEVDIDATKSELAIVYLYPLCAYSKKQILEEVKKYQNLIL